MTQPDRTTDDQAIPLACRREAGAFSPAQRDRYRTLRKQLQTAFRDAEELADGYAFYFPPHADTLMTLAEFIVLEQRCCPFFRFALVLEPGEVPLRLELTGPAGVKEFLQAEFSAG